MNSPIKLSSKAPRLGFSLTEVVVSLGLFAIAIPAIIAVFALLSRGSTDTRDLNDIESITSAIELYLQNGSDLSGEAIPIGGDFSVVYGWVNDNRGSEDNTTILYAYHPKEGDEDLDVTDEDASHRVSSIAPTEDLVSAFDGRIMAIEVRDPEESILPTAEFPPNPDNYKRAYLPMRFDIFTIVESTETRSASNFVESVLFVLDR